MRRRVWLIATATALFGLQAPLCALACIESPVEAAAMAGCHEDASESPPADESTHEGCGCEPAYDALLPSPPAIEATASASSLAFAPPGDPVRAIGPAVRHGTPVPKVTDLPPPDILLRTSTLLI